MKNLKSIFLLLLFCLSAGQGVLGFSGNQPLSDEGQIQPVHSTQDEAAFPSAVGLLDAESRPESRLQNSGNLHSVLSEVSEEEEDHRRKTEESLSKHKKIAWLFKSEIIERSLTFRELIYPHHFYF